MVKRYILRVWGAGVLQMGALGRTWEALGVQSGALGALLDIKVSSWISECLFERLGAAQVGRGIRSAGRAVPAEGGEALPPSFAEVLYTIV